MAHERCEKGRIEEWGEDWDRVDLQLADAVAREVVRGTGEAWDEP